MVGIKQKLKEIITNYKDSKPFDVVINQMLSLYFEVEEESKGIENLDNPITGAFLEYHGFTSKYGNNYYEILIKNKHYFSITQIIQEDGFVENNIGFRDVKDNDEIFIDYTELKTEKQLINLIQTLFGVTLIKKQ